MSPPYLRRKPRGKRIYRDGESMPAQPTREDCLARLRELVEGIDTATLTTIDADGSLRSRPMAAQPPDDDGVLWFFTADYSPKVHEVLLHPEVCVNYAAPERRSWVSVSGKAELVRERETLQRWWTNALHEWLPRGIDDPDLALLRIDIESAQYWDTHSVRLVQLLERVKSAVSGTPEPPHGGSHLLTLKHRIGPDTIS